MASDADKANIQESFGKLPLYFIENHGQMDEEVDFYVKGADKTLYFTESGITFAITERKERSPNPDLFSIDKPEIGNDPRQSDEEVKRWIVKMDFVGANPGAQPRGNDQQDAVFSYFKGKPEEWNTSIPTYSKIVYEDLWPGIDLVFYGTINKLKYDFIVKPGADPQNIRFAVSGASNVVLEESGNIEIKTPLGSFEDEKPTAYQEIDGKRSAVSVRYSLEYSECGDLYNLGFDVGEFDPRGSLVIDPVVLVYCGYIGGDGWESCGSIDVDKQRNAYVAGITDSSVLDSFPVKVGPDLTFNGEWDVFVAKIAASGESLVYCGYIGGMDYEYFSPNIAVDEHGNAYVAGTTQSSEDEGFPVKTGPDLTMNGSRDAFVAKVSASGDTLIYCGYIGGDEGLTGCSDVAVDRQGNAYLSGSTSCSEDHGFPVKIGPDLTFNGYGEPGSHNIGDGFVTKVAASGRQLIYCGYIGGSKGDGAYGIAIDPDGNAYITGNTESNNLPVLIGPDLNYAGGDSWILSGDGFVAKVSASGESLEYCGYIGGSQGDTGASIAVDQNGNAYVVGSTESTEADGFPVKVGPDLTMDPLDDNAFVAKISASGDQFLYCGYIGGGDSGECGCDIAVDGKGNAYVTGTVSTFLYPSDFPVLLGPDLTYSGCSDAFVSKISASGADFIYSGFIGGGHFDNGYGIAIDELGNAYVLGTTYSSENDGFPVLVGPDLTLNGDDVFIAKVLTTGLYCDTYNLSAATGGAVALNLTAGAENAGREYYLLGSARGISPGTQLPGGNILPLNWDGLTKYVASYANTQMFQNFNGPLDASGEATAILNATPVDPAFVGDVLHFAFVLCSPYDFVSNPVPITIVP